MLQKLNLSLKKGNSQIAILYPGLAFSGSDSGYGTIGRIDQATIPSGVTIKMHPHVNDDIFSYFRIGKVQHTDSEGFSELITPKRFMLMKAGVLFHHEETILEDLVGLQIFIRPKFKDNTPEVIFQELDEVHSINQWRLIASPDSRKTVLKLSSDTWIFDLTIDSEDIFKLPENPKPDFVYFLYVFQGNLFVNSKIELNKGECLYIQNENIQFSSISGAEVVLFVTNTKSDYYDGGMYSGNQLNKCS